MQLQLRMLNGACRSSCLVIRQHLSCMHCAQVCVRSLYKETMICVCACMGACGLEVTFQCAQCDTCRQTCKQTCIYTTQMLALLMYRAVFIKAAM